MADLYICSSNVDRDYVFPAVEALEAAGFSCCLPGRDYDFGPDWVESLTDAVYSSEMAIYFDSEAARKSFRIRKELEVIAESGRLRIDTEPGPEAEKLVLTVRERISEAREILRQSARLVPYTGEEDYIFVSYAHRNIEKVFPIIRWLQQDGYRIWFDEGIDPGTEWAENIASHLEGSSFLIACMSPEYLESTNCCDELSYAREMNRPILLIYLEPMKLEGLFRMRYMTCPAVEAPLPEHVEAFLKAVGETEQIRSCKNMNQEGDRNA